MKNLKYILGLMVLVLASACEDALDEQPFHLITNDLVIESAEDYNSVVLGMYDGLQSGNAYGNQLITMPGVLSDEMIHTGSFPTVSQFDFNDIVTDNVTMQNTWNTTYNTIFRANFLIANIDVVPLDANLRNQYLGEAKFVRSLCYTDLVKLFGGVPLAIGTDLETLRVLPRSSETEIYNFIKTDLGEAATLLQGVDHGDAAGSRASEWSAKALLARVNLYSGDVAAAGNLANDVITNGGFALEDDYSAAFSGSSDEVIFQVAFDANDRTGLPFQTRASDGGRFEYGVSAKLVNAFEAGDERIAMISDNGNGTFEAAKYVDVATGTDPTAILRLSEMLLIRAEANLGSAGADADLNAVRNRAGLGDISGADLDDILAERFVEFCFEAHRWTDLKRTGRIDQVMSVVNPTTWQSTDALLPIPQREINQNPSLVGNQNPGY